MPYQLLLYFFIRDKKYYQMLGGNVDLLDRIAVR
jgi:hypothetical protein